MSQVLGSLLMHISLLKFMALASLVKVEGWIHDPQSREI